METQPQTESYPHIRELLEFLKDKGIDLAALNGKVNNENGQREETN
jgi:hypothetical protein